MNDEPYGQDSAGDSPTFWAEGGRGHPAVDSPHWADRQLEAFVEPGSELPPELLAEQKAVLLKPGDMVVGRFEVIEQLGLGGMGAVYRVRDHSLEEDRALKVMLPSLLVHSRARSRFLKEIRISQRLTHEGIVRVHDLGEDRERGIVFFTMEYVSGQTLHRLLVDRHQRLPWERAVDIARQICDALEHAHKHTIHRDLKPQNIMVRPDGSVKVMDFGLAKVMTPGKLTESTLAMGTAYYQAPEQGVHAGNLSPAADIYSLGVILYQMLAGTIPIGHVRPPSTICPTVPRKLDNVVLACLEPRPEDRLRSIPELREALDAALVKKTPRWVLALAAFVVIAATALAGFFLWPNRPPLNRRTWNAAVSTVVHRVSASEAENAQTEAAQAKQDAQAMGAERYAAPQSSLAAISWERGEDLRGQGLYYRAVPEYDKAEQLLVTAAGVTRQLLAKRDQARQDAANARAEADRAGAADLVPNQYEQAQKAQQDADQTPDVRQATEKYQDAREAYILAAKQAEAIVQVAQRNAEDAKERAATGDVAYYVPEQLSEPAALMQEAEQAADPQTKKEKYEAAAARYEDTVGAARQALLLAMAASEQAKTTAAEARDAARKAGAQEHAGDTLQEALDLIETADAHAQDRKFDVAANAYADATAKLQEAARLAKQEKQRILLARKLDVAPTQTTLSRDNPEAKIRVRLGDQPAPASAIQAAWREEGSRFKTLKSDGFILVQVLPDQLQQGTYRLDVRASGQSKSVDVAVETPAPKPAEPTGPSEPGTPGGEHYEITLPERYVEGQIMDVPGTGEAQFEYIWKVNGEVVLQGVGKSRLRHALSKPGTCTLELVQKLDGQTVISTRATTSVASEPVEHHTTTLGYTVKFPAAPERYRDYEWRVDGTRVPGGHEFKYIFEEPKTYRLECKMTDPLSPAEQEYRKYRRIVWLVHVE